MTTRNPSDAIKQGLARTPNRSMLWAVGFTAEDFQKPWVGVGSCWSEGTPCNFNNLRLAGLIKEGIAFAVRSMEIEFVRAAHIDDELVVDTSLIEMTGARFTLDQSIERGDELVARAKVVAVAIKTDGKPTRLPRSLVAALAK